MTFMAGLILGSEKMLIVNVSNAGLQGNTGLLLMLKHYVLPGRASEGGKVTCCAKET